MGLDRKIQILGFVNNSEELLKKSKLFIFPANIVFCNNALLEAMSFGCVPVVANGEGAYRIVNDSNGTSLQVSKKIVSLSNNRRFAKK